MIHDWATRLRLLRRQEGTQVLPALVGERWDSKQAQGSREICRDGRSLASATLPMEALRSRLMPASKVRPV
jgi:hypothetical protein